MTMPARKFNFEDIVRTVPFLTVGEKETLEIMLQKELYDEIKERRLEYETDCAGGNTFSIEEVLKEIKKRLRYQREPEKI